MDLVLDQAEPKGEEKRANSARNSKNSSSLYRTSVKPLIEKRRRARINASLEQLRKLLQQPSDQQNGRALSRLEKAEILEMTVQQLRQLKQQGAVVPSPSQDSQNFAAGYCHCIKTVSNSLNSAGYSFGQAMTSQILQHLEEAPGTKTSTAPAPVSKVWQRHKAHPLPSLQPSFLWASPPSLRPAGPPLSDSHTLVGSWSNPSPTSMLLPHLHVPWTQPTSPAATTHMWRPW
ncbi:transcription factor HES-2-like [Elgaria multicarinata webbii]|uniref:transcription factor HES-2-like n=1 Tax=Elgaria multicarinata webbii TaxID=159646 RepID=UPI002FCD268F